MSWFGTDLLRTVTTCTGIVIFVQVLTTTLILGALHRLRHEHDRFAAAVSKLLHTSTDSQVVQCTALSALVNAIPSAHQSRQPQEAPLGEVIVGPANE
jgi:hypothetical protein